MPDLSASVFLDRSTSRTFVANAAIGIAFSASSYITLLAYPAIAFFSTPVIVFYCFAFLVTAMNAREFWWKVAVSGILLSTMLAAHIPLFFKNLYSDTYGAYFSDRIWTTDPLLIWKYSTIVSTFWPEAKVLLFCFVSFCTAIYCAVRGHGGIRRFAIGLLTCEAGFFAIGGVCRISITRSLYFIRTSCRHPSWQNFLCCRCCSCPSFFSRAAAIFLRRILKQAEQRDRALWMHYLKKCSPAVPVIFLIVSPFLVPRERPFDTSSYPPARPPSVQIMSNELELSPGKPFGGRVYSLVQQNYSAASGSDINPLLNSVLSILENHYGRYTGNDHWTDLLSLNIPVVGEYAQWATPIDFVFLREFFGRKDDIFQKSLFILRAYNERAARMIGIRYVVSDAESVPGTTLVYQRMAGDTPLRLFRIDDTNLGQYSPTRLTRIATAAEALVAIKSGSFDPKLDAVVEEDLPADLVPATLQSLTVELGPALHVRAQSAGTSLLVLPFGYSHCLRLETQAGTSARLIPVNLQQTGLLFDRRADVEITYSFGPLDQPICRGDDLARMDRLRLREAF